MTFCQLAWALNSCQIIHRFCLRGGRREQPRDFVPKVLFASIGRHETIRMFLAKVTSQHLPIEGANISNVSLYGTLNKPVLMQLPTNSGEKPAFSNQVALVVKSLCRHWSAGQTLVNLLYSRISAYIFR